MFPTRIVSGGQTGVDRAALDVALEVGIAPGGWCPRGRRAEDEPIPLIYPLRETPRRNYRQRTEWNVRDSDATLILARGRLSGGTRLTRDLAAEQAKPCRVVDLDDPVEPLDIRRWLEGCGARTLNVAGPRESQAPGIYASAAAYLRALLAGAGPGRAAAG